MRSMRSIFRSVRQLDTAFVPIWYGRNSSSRLRQSLTSRPFTTSSGVYETRERTKLMPHFGFNDIEIYYETQGSGTPLLLVPGLGGVGSYWKPQIDLFARHFQVLVHD